MKSLSLLLGWALVGCGSSTATDDIAYDASSDRTMMQETSTSDVSLSDALDDGMDTGTGDDGSAVDASGDAGDGGIVLDGGKVLDAGPDGSICPPCKAGELCCTIMKSLSYGKCYPQACLACCM